MVGGKNKDVEECTQGSDLSTYCTLQEPYSDLRSSMGNRSDNMESFFLMRGKRRGALVDLPGRALIRCQSVGMCQSATERKLSGCAKSCLSRCF